MKPATDLSPIGRAGAWLPDRRSHVRWLGVIAGLLLGSSIAAAQDGRFEFSPDGSSVTIEVQHVPRRDVLGRLFRGTNVEVSWRSTALGDEPISGSFSGSPADVARQVLRDTDFAIGYDSNANPARVIILGPSRKRAGSVPLAAAPQPTATLANASPGSRAASSAPATTGSLPTPPGDDAGSPGHAIVPAPESTAR